MLIRRSSILASLAVLLCLLLIFQYGTPQWFGDATWAIFPLNIHQWKGIWLGAFVHGSWDHLWGNVIALTVFSALFMIQFPTQWFRFWIVQHFLASLLLWFIGNVGMDLARTGSAHIGASIWVYAFGGFILTAAIIQKTKQSMAIFFLVLLIYGGFFWGLLPVDPKVSWQGHISGLIVGAVIARWKVRQWLPSIPREMELRDGDDNQENGELEDPYIHI